MEILKPGKYTFTGKEGPVYFQYLHDKEDLRYPHKMQLTDDVREPSSAGVAEGIDVDGALLALGIGARMFLRKKFGQIAAVDVLNKRVSVIEEEVEEGRIEAEQGGRLMQLAAGRFTSLYREHLPAQVHVSPVWRINTESGSLIRPWNERPGRPEPHEVWWTHRRLVVEALARNVKRVIL